MKIINHEGKEIRNAVIDYFVKNKGKRLNFKQICVAVIKRSSSNAVRNCLIRLESDGVIKVERTNDGIIAVNYYTLNKHENI
jgi:hypothetical protein